LTLSYNVGQTYIFAVGVGNMTKILLFSGWLLTCTNSVFNNDSGTQRYTRVMGRLYGCLVKSVYVPKYYVVSTVYGLSKRFANLFIGSLKCACLKGVTQWARYMLPTHLLVCQRMVGHPNRLCGLRQRLMPLIQGAPLASLVLVIKLINKMPCGFFGGIQRCS
jgi:hypothetical protein